MKSDHLAGGPAIETAGLVKTFGDNRAVDGVDLRIERGTVYGLLGPNGAGKSTLLRLILGQLEPDTGTVRLGANVPVAYFDQMREQLDPE